MEVFVQRYRQLNQCLTTTKGRELSKVLQEKNYSFLSTGSPTYWPKDDNKIPDLLDFFITNGISTTYVDIQASYDLTSDHTPIIATISTSFTVRQPPPRLHTSQTNWETYRNLVRDKANLAIKLKEREDVELAIDNFISVLQHAAQEATPTSNPQRPTNNILSEIKRFVAAKRKARSTWQRTIHQTADDYLTKQAINLNLHSMKCGTHPLLPIVLTLKEMIILFGNQSKIRKNLKHHSLQYANTRYRRDHRPRVIKKKPTSSQNTYRKYCLLIMTIRIKTWNGT